MPRFQDIPQFISGGSYAVNVPWTSVERTLEEYTADSGLDLDPDFQRGHVWTERQQTAYVEYILRGGKSSRMIQFNAPAWNVRQRGRGPIVLVDGKQRLEAVRKFLRNDLPAFGHRFAEYVDRLRITGPDFVFNVNDLTRRADVLQWYIDLNAGRVVHAEDEINRVRAMLLNESRAARADVAAIVGGALRAGRDGRGGQ